MKLALPVILKILLLSSMLHVSLNAQHQSLEFAEGPGNPTGQGPVTFTTIKFMNNVNNPSRNRFITQEPELSVRIELTNQQYTNHPQNTNSNSDNPNNPASVIGWYFGAQEAEPIFSPMSLLSGPENRFFTSTKSVSEGTGIDVDINKAVLIANGVSILNGKPFDARYHLHDLEITFDMPVNNPVLHIVGLGGQFAIRGVNRGLSAELELMTPGVTLSSLSGSNVFNVTTTRIRNSAAQPGNSGINNAASGSVLVVGQEVTSLIFRVFVRGEAGFVGENWGEDVEDGWMLGISLNADDLVKFVDRKIEGKITDEMNQIISRASVFLSDINNKVIDSTLSDLNGKFEFTVDRDKTYKLEALRDGFVTSSKTISTATEKRSVDGTLILKKLPEFTLYTKVIDHETGEGLVGVSVTMTNNFTGEKEVYFTKNNGEFHKNLKESKLSDRVSFDIRLEKEGYMSKKLTYNKQLDHEGIYKMFENLDFALNPIAVGMDIAQIIDIQPIYFDLNKADIRPDAALELDKVVQVMNENQGMEVELRAHTDCRGSAAYNLDLSDKRAKAAAKYIQEHISKPERISGKGYGESLPVNDCNCDVAACPEEQHAENRRTEFKIIRI